MKMKMLVAMVLAVCATVAFGQDYAFKVLVNKGKNEVKSGTNWQPVKVGSSLKSVDELKVSDNAYVGLIHVSGKPLEVKSAGKYKVAELAAKIGGGASVLNKYTEFILSAPMEKKNNLSATGAVHRGAGNIAIYLRANEVSYFANDSVSIQWAKDKAGPPYAVTFTSLFGEELYKTETTSNIITVNLNAGDFLKENDIQVQVYSKKDKKESDTYVLRRLARPEKEKIRTAFSEIAGQTAAPTALNKLVQAGFYEQNKLLVDAATAYLKAIKLEPGVQAYQEAYDDFLLRNGLKQK
jgi:hypothetical protein